MSEITGETLCFLERAYVTMYFREEKNQLSTKPFNLSLRRAEWKKHHFHLLHISTSLVWNFDLVTPWRLFNWYPLSVIYLWKGKLRTFGSWNEQLFILPTKKNKSHQNICIVLDLALILWLLLPLLFLQYCVCQLGRTHRYQPSNLKPEQYLTNILFKSHQIFQGKIPQKSVWTNKLKGGEVHNPVYTDVFSVITLACKPVLDKMKKNIEKYVLTRINLQVLENWGGNA